MTDLPLRQLLKFTVEEKDDRVVLALHGELNMYTVKLFENELAKLEVSGPQTLVVDLREVTFMESMGLAAIIATDRRSRTDDRRVLIVRGPEIVDRLFEVTRIGETLEVIDHPDAAQAPTRPPS